MKPTISTAAAKAAHEAQLAERKENPALKQLERTDGAPDHWIGGGAKERMQAEASRCN